MWIVIFLSTWSTLAVAGRTNFRWLQDSAAKFAHEGRSLQETRYHTFKEYPDFIAPSRPSFGRFLKLKDHAEPSVEGDALLKASFNGNLTIVKREIRKGIDANIISAEGGSTPLILAAANGHSKIVSFLLDNGADIEARDDLGFTALLEASLWGETDVVRILLEEGADIDALSGAGSTPFFVAAKGGHADIVEALLKAGAGIEERLVETNSTPLLLAAEMGQLDVVEILLENGADVTVTDESDTTALHYVSRIRGENSDIISTLLDGGADIDSQNEFGWTPLHFAAWNGQNSTIHTLVKSGADKLLVDESSRTAKDFFCLCLDPGDGVAPFCDVTTCKVGEEQRKQILAVLE